MRLLSLCRRAQAALLAALHESRSREAARIVRRYQHLVETSRDVAPAPTAASETRRRRSSRAREDAFKPALIAVVIGFALIHGIALGMLAPHASSDAAVVLKGD
jgi:hypothetical protein